MFQFNRELILPLFLSKGMTVAVFARQAGVSFKAASRAVNGQPVSAPIAQRVAAALGVDVLKYLCSPT